MCSFCLLVYVFTYLPVFILPCYNLSHGYSCRHYCYRCRFVPRRVVDSAFRLSYVAICPATDLLSDQTSAYTRRMVYSGGWIVVPCRQCSFGALRSTRCVSLFSSLADNYNHALDYT